MQKNIRSRCCRKEKSPIFGHRKQRRKEEAPPKTNNREVMIAKKSMRL